MAKTIFEHIAGVSKNKVKWESLGEDDKKSWSNFLISRWFSMDMNLVETINVFQQYSNGILTSKDYYNLLYHSLPKTSFFLKYVKKKGKIDMDKEFIETFCDYFQLGKKNIYEYIWMLKDSNPDELVSILKAYGTREQDIEKFKTQLKKLK